MTGKTFPLSVRLKAKWGAPSIADAFDRQRLFKAFDDLRNSQCTWLVAPGGYGKTYLLQSYIQSGRQPALWYSLDEGDSDVVTFIADLSDALEAAGYGPMLRLSSDVEQISRFGRYYFQQLAEQLEKSTLLILDDYHRVAADSGLHEVLAAAIESLAPSIRLVVLSREVPPPAFARLHAHRQIGLIDINALTLDEDEALGIARAVMGERLTDRAIREAWRRADGWAAGFVVLLDQSDPSMLAAESKNTLFRYFEHEVLAAATDALCSFLWQTALFHTFNAGMAERLTSRKHTAAMLGELLGGNYFLRVSQSSEPVYRYHDLFRDYLLDYGRRCHGDEWPDAARRAAGILSENDELDAAASLYTEITDWSGLGKLINRHGGRLLQRGSHRTLARWLTRLPVEMRDRQPWFIYWDGCSRLATDPRQARERLRQAFVVFVREGEHQGALLAWAAVCQASWIAFDDMRPLEGWLTELDALWPARQASAMPEEIEAQVALGAFLCLIVVRPDDPALYDWERRLMRLLESGHNPDLGAMAATLLLFHFVWTVGDRGRARLLRDALRIEEQDRDIAPMTLVITRSWGDFSYEYGFGGSLEHCLEALHLALDTGAARGVHLYDASLYGGMAYCHLTSGAVEQARRVLERMEKALDPERSYDVGFYLWLRTWEAWLGGRYIEAADLGRQQQAMADRFGFMHPLPMSLLSAAQVANSLGRRADALKYLAAIGQWARRTGSRIGTYMRGLALAQFSLENGRRERAHRLLKATLTLGQLEGYVGPPFFRPADVVGLFAEALSAGIETDYVIRVIRSRELPPPRGMALTERWPWPVKVRVLGEFALELDGSSTRVSERKGQQKPLELLKALVALGGEGIPWERLADMMWPNVEGDRAATNFKTTLGRLRKLLGQHGFLLVRDGKVSLSREHCWTDIWQFVELDGEIDAVSRPNGIPPRAGRIGELADRLAWAYPRPLLCGDHESWITSLRHRLHNRYIRDVNRLAGLMERSEAPALATDIRASVRSLEDAE